MGAEMMTQTARGAGFCAPCSSPRGASEITVLLISIVLPMCKCVLTVNAESHLLNPEREWELAFDMPSLPSKQG